MNCIKRFTLLLAAAVLLSACATSRINCVIPKADGETLESYGQTRAAEHNIFCNMMDDHGTPAAVLNYFERSENKPYIVQSYIYDRGAYFKESRHLFRTRAVSPLGSSLNICLPCKYETVLSADSSFPYELICTCRDTDLPPLKIRRFPMNDFPAMYIAETDRLTGISPELIASLADGGWTRDELAELYGSSFKLMKREIVERNGLNIAFLGYADSGVLKVRAFIEDNDSYIMLCAEAAVSEFQHVTNAIIDSIQERK